MSIEAKPALNPEIPALWARVFADTLSQYRAWAFRDKAAPFSRDPARVREEEDRIELAAKYADLCVREFADRFDPEAAVRDPLRDVRSLPVDALELSVRSRNACDLAHVDTIGQLQDLGESGLRNIPNVGTVTVGEIRNKLEGRGLILAP